MQSTPRTPLYACDLMMTNLMQLILTMTHFQPTHAHPGVVRGCCAAWGALRGQAVQQPLSTNSNRAAKRCVNRLPAPHSCDILHHPPRPSKSTAQHRASKMYPLHHLIISHRIQKHPQKHLSHAVTARGSAWVATAWQGSCSKQDKQQQAECLSYGMHPVSRKARQLTPGQGWVLGTDKPRARHTHGARQQTIRR